VPNQEKVTISELHKKYQAGEKLTMVTAYDYPTSLLVDRAGMDIVLVGDSVAMTVLGHSNTLPVTMEEMIIFTKAVTRACRRPFVIGDMPYMSYQISVEEAIRNAGRFMGEAGTDAIKLEGGRNVSDRVEAIIRAGIPVMGHIGLTPQSVSMMSGFKVQGRTGEAAKNLLDDALALEQAEVFAILLELVPDRVAKVITERLSIPTVGIGAGIDCSGQALIFHDLIGLFEVFTPKHVKQYADISGAIETALKQYVEDVHAQRFPETAQSFTISDEEFQQFMALAG